MPVPTDVWITRLPWNLCIGTLALAATMIASAAAMSADDSSSYTPPAPRVSTWIATPRFAAHCFNDSAAMNDEDIPVGHAVTAKILTFVAAFVDASDFSRAASFSSINLKNSSTDLASISASLNSGSINSTASLPISVIDLSSAFSGAANKNNSRAGRLSIELKSTPEGTVIALIAGFLTLEF